MTDNKPTTEEKRKFAERVMPSKEVYSDSAALKITEAVLSNVYYDCCVMREALEKVGLSHQENYDGWQDLAESYEYIAKKALSQVSTYPSPNEPH